VNDQVYQVERARKLEAREINDMEKRAMSRRHVHQQLDKQVYSHNEQRKNEEQVKSLML
jgi:hypothetical protein